MNKNIAGGYSKQGSPWLTCTRKEFQDEESEELKSVSTVTMVGADRVPSLIVSGLNASWSRDEDKLVLEGINFILDSVSTVCRWCQVSNPVIMCRV